MAQNLKIAFLTLGCKLNYAETSTYERKLLAGEAGSRIEVVPWSEGADVYLVNTCSVTEHSDKKCRNIIRKLHRQSPEAAIFVTGCYAQLKKDEIESIEGVRRVFGAKEKRLVVPEIAGYATGLAATLEAEASEEFFGAYSTGERTRSFLKVQDGCDFKCAYCTVPYARGESRSEPISAIVRKAEEIAATGCREIVLTGVNTGDFGKTTGESFFDLLKALNALPGIERYRISSIEPNLLTEEMILWLASGTRFLPHFHIPLQSGCDEILKQMGRRYDTGTFASRIALIRKAFAPRKVFFGFDVIVGFPGETGEHFRQTCDFLENVARPSFIHVFPYSRRAGTPAALRKDQVQDSIKSERVARLEELSARLHREFIESCIGDSAEVLIESRTKDGLWAGYTENYIRVCCTGGEVGKCSRIVLDRNNTGLDKDLKAPEE
ncbi:MAG: tRNA (N(6)-L-threonylcarbamoyladenosine(37)-C(2))-methylthiotransferase MtaB [Candidatus Cryptobacteroides sp.]